VSSGLRRKDLLVPDHDVLFGASLGQWSGADAGSVQQWVTELTTAVLEHHAVGFIYRSTDDTPADEALARWATEIVPAVREAIA
jgi:hypothetical protein